MAGIVVENWQNLNRLFAKAEKETRAEFRAEQRTIAEPTRRGAEVLANASIRRIGPTWGQMRTGVTQRMIYVAPRRRGVSRNSPRSRPNFARLIQTRAMTPALAAHTQQIRQDFEQMLNRVANRFNGAP